MAETQTVGGVHDPTASPNNDADGRFEDECINLLCKQENSLSLLGEASRKRRALDSLDLAKKMLVQFLDFAETHFDNIQFRCVGQKLYVVNQRTRQYEKMLVAKSYKLLRRMVGMKVPTAEELHEANEQLRSEYIELYEEFFANCARRLSADSGIQKQFAESVATFLSEFEERWFNAPGEQQPSA